MDPKLFAVIIACICCLAICLPAGAEDPGIAFGPLGQFPVGTMVIINGTTNLAPGDHLAVEVYSQTFGPTPKTGNGTFYGSSGVVTVRQGQPGVNLWSFPVNTSGFPPDTYVVVVTGLEVQVTESTTFTLVPAVTATASLPVTPPSSSPSTPPTSVTPSASPTTTQTSGAGEAVCLTGLVVGFAFFARKKQGE